MSREEYLDERGKFKCFNKGGGRPKKQRPEDFEPKVEPMYERLVTKACELQGVEDKSELSPNVEEFLESWRMSKVQVEMIRARSMGPNDQTLLAKFLSSGRQSLKDALDAAVKERKIEIEKAKGKGGKKPTGMY